MPFGIGPIPYSATEGEMGALRRRWEPSEFKSPLRHHVAQVTDLGIVRSQSPGRR